MPAPTPVPYSSRDYDAVRQALISRIPTHLPEWKNRTENDFGITLIELFAYMGDQLSYYIDRAANETSIQTAVLRESVLAFADLVGYVVGDMHPATGAVTFTVQPGRTTDTLIPAGTVVQTTSATSDSPPLPYTTDEDLVISTLASSGSVAVTQGRIVDEEIIGTSNGGPAQNFSLFEIRVEADTVLVDVVSPSIIEGDDITTRWGRVNSLLSAGPTDQVYTVFIDANDVAYVRFGDGANGLVPPAETVIKATYRTADGTRGNVGIGAVTTIPTYVEGVTGVTNAAPMAGGVDRESITDIRKSLPGSIKAVNRAVTLEDFEPLAEQVLGVLHAKAAAAVYTNVTVYVVPTGGGTPSTSLKNEVKAWLEGRSLIGTTCTVSNPSYEPVNINLNLYVLPQFFAQETNDRVNDALLGFFNLINSDLGKTITLSDIYKTILDVDGVDFVEVTLLARDDVAQTGTANQTFLINEIPTAGDFTINVTGGI